MCPRTTLRVLALTGLLAVAGAALAQTTGPEWRHLGNSALELGLPSLATGPVDRVWYSTDGAVLYAKTATGHIFQTTDFEQWQRVADPRIAPPTTRFNASGPV